MKHINMVTTDDDCDIEIEATKKKLMLTFMTGHNAASSFSFDHDDARVIAERIINAPDNVQQKGE